MITMNKLNSHWKSFVIVLLKPFAPTLPALPKLDAVVFTGGIGENSS